MRICVRCGVRFQAPDFICRACGYSAEQIMGFPAFAPELADSSNGFNPGARLSKQKSVEHYDGMAELKLGNTVNLVLEKTMDFERLLIRAGLSLPAGGSLLLIARKH